LSWILLEKPPVARLLKNFAKFYGIWKFITVFTRAFHWALSWVRSIPPPLAISLFWKNGSGLMRSPFSLYIRPPPSTFEWPNQYLWNLVCTVYYGTWTHLNSLRHKSLPSVCVCMCIPLFLLGNSSVKDPLSLLGNGSVKTSPRKRMHTQQQKNYWTRRCVYNPCRIKESIGD
jgi:hypothetical protein